MFQCGQQSTVNSVKYLYPEMSYRIIGIMYAVFNTLGPGFREKHYQKAIAKLFKDLGIKFREQVPVKIVFGSTKIGTYLLDFLIEESIIVEIKVGDNFSPHYINQVKGYLKTAGLKLGLLVYFTNKGVRYKRILNLY